LEHLSGMKIATESEAFEAMMLLHDKGTEVVILSSSEICTESGLAILSDS
jgi:pyridoxal/pyridoxine/pyridoxamine kinase